MDNMFSYFLLACLFSYLDKQGFLKAAEFRGHCLNFLERTYMPEDEKERYREMIRAMPGLGIVD